MGRVLVWAALFAVATSCFADSDAASAQVAQASPFYRLVAAGRTLRVDAFTAMNPDCSSQGPTTVNLVSAPRGGQVTVGRDVDYPNYAALNVRAACDRRRVPQTTIEYRASPGFVGRDQFTVELQFPGGLARTVRYFVNVRPAVGGEAVHRVAETASCSNEGRLQSLNSAVPAHIVFVSRSVAPRTIYWLNFQGQRVRYGTLAPGARLAFNTYLTHPWLVAKGNDICTTVALPRAMGSVVTIR